MKILNLLYLGVIGILMMSCKEETVINADIIGKWELREKGCTCYEGTWQPVTGINIEYLEFNADSTFYSSLACPAGSCCTIYF